MPVIHDARFAIRAMRKNPGFTTVAILALALGIGANTAIFTVVNGVLLRPLPFKEPDRLAFLTRHFPGGDIPSISIPKFSVWKQNTAAVFSHVAAYDFMGPGVSLSGQGQPEQVKAIHASADYFGLFGVSPAAGRFYSAEEDRPGGPHVAVISAGLWKRRFGSDPAVIGRPATFSGEPFTVIGVAAEGFDPSPAADVWFPLQADPATINQGHYLLCAGRLRPGVTMAAASARVKAAGEQFRRQYPGVIDKTESASAVPMQDFLVGNIKPILLVMLGAVGFVLLIACANVANLLLARSAAREKEMAIRSAMGAGRWRVVRQLVTESGVLALAGGALGLLFGLWGIRALVLLAPSDIPLMPDLNAHLGLDVRVLGFTLLVSLATGLLFGLAPALQVSRPDLNTTLRENSGRSTSGLRHMRARGLLVVTEMALGLVLLIGAGLLIRSALSMRAVEPGFATSGVLTFKTALTGARHSTTASVMRFNRAVAERLESVPGIRAAGNIISLPTEPGPDLSFRIEGRASSASNSTGDELWRFVTPHALNAMGVPLLRGRFFADTDSAQAPAAIVINEAFARKYWPKQDPLGQRLTIGDSIGSEFADVTREVVGIVGNVHESGLSNDPPPIMYVPQAQMKDSLTALGSKILPTAWAVRTQGDPLAMAAIVRREVTSVDSEQAVFDFRSMAQVVQRSMAIQRFVLTLLTAFAAIALLLAAIGIYGVMAYDVEQRASEIGIRMALGAAQGDVIRLVVRHGMLLASIGVAVGLAAAFGVTRLLSAMLYGVKATDPLTFASVAVMLTLVALAATYIPARRAARVDPMTTLR